MRDDFFAALDDSWPNRLVLVVGIRVAFDTHLGEPLTLVFITLNMIHALFEVFYHTAKASCRGQT
jgi:hypothetical protein